MSTKREELVLLAWYLDEAAHIALTAIDFGFTEEQRDSLREHVRRAFELSSMVRPEEPE